MQVHDDEALRILDIIGRAFVRLEQNVPPPERVPYLDDYVYRYQEKTIEQAIVLKLARRASTLRAAFILHKNSHLQEQAALQRMMDEQDDDIMFLVLAITRSDFSDLHLRFLSDFFEEEFDKPGDPIGSTQKRASIPRKKIHAYLARSFAILGDPSRATTLSKTIQKTYSGFVHSAAVHVFEMYGGMPPNFHIFGIRDPEQMALYGNDLGNYFYRALCSFAVAAKAFGDAELHDALKAEIDALDGKSD